jgi:hypothetical protein
MPVFATAGTWDCASGCTTWPNLENQFDPAIERWHEPRPLACPASRARPLPEDVHTPAPPGVCARPIPSASTPTRVCACEDVCAPVGPVCGQGRGAGVKGVIGWVGDSCTETQAEFRPLSAASREDRLARTWKLSSDLEARTSNPSKAHRWPQGWGHRVRAYPMGGSGGAHTIV